MLFFQLLFVASLATFLNAQNFTCGIRPFGPVNKIVNGVKAIPGDWAWSISLTTNGRHFCGGVLINDQWILTAGHCFQGASLSTLSVDIGVHNRNIKEPWVVNRKVAKVIVHEAFSINTLTNDIALVKLASPIVLDQKYYIPACIPDDDSLDFLAQEKVAWLTGWGSQYFQGPVTVEKYQVSMKLISDVRCKQRYAQMYDANKQLCGGESTGNSGACQGDSGGPFVRQMEDGKWYIIGLISWGYGCGQGTVFTRVTYYLPWIKNKIATN